MHRDLWSVPDSAVRFVAAVVIGAVPKRYWPSLDTHLPVMRTPLVSALACIALAVAIGIPAFLRHAESNARHAVDLMLQATGWRAAPSAMPIPHDQVAVATWNASFFSLLTFLLSTPLGLVTLYLTFAGVFRVISVVVDDARGDPLLTLFDSLGRRAWHAHAAHRQRVIRERREGPEVPDRLVRGQTVGFPEADFVVIASRRKPEWDAGLFVLTPDKWYRLGVPVDRQTRYGLRTLYPLTLLRANEVLRRGVPYSLPPLDESRSSARALVEIDEPNRRNP